MIIFPSTGTSSGTSSDAISGSSSDSSNTSLGTPSDVRGMPPIVGPGAASTASPMAVVPTAGAMVPVVVAAPDALGASDVLEEEELCGMENYSEWNVDTRRKKAEYKKIRQPEIFKLPCRVV
jgi:hypothetical protein